MPSVSLVYGRLRPEEKLLLEAGGRLGIDVQPVHEADVRLDLDGGIDGDVALVRSVSTSRGLTLLRALDAWGTPAVNRYDVAARCADKAHTSWLLHAAGVPTPDIRVAFTPETALEALDDLGYPAVLKPVQGSWARLVAKVRDRAEAEQLLEHRALLPNPLQHIYYAQAYVEKGGGDGGDSGDDHRDFRATSRDGDAAPRASPETPRDHRDFRAFVVGDRTIACIARIAPHWITNTARGARTEAVEVDDGLDDLCVRAAEAMGGGVLAMDLMQTPDGWTVHEINHTMEFRNSIGPTGVDIPGEVLQYCVTEARA